MIPRPPRSTRTYTLFPYTTRVRTPAGRSAANNIRQSLAAHSKRCLRRFANPLLQRTKARSTAGRECEDQSIDGPGVVPDDLVRALPLVNLEDDGKQSAHHQRVGIGAKRHDLAVELGLEPELRLTAVNAGDRVLVAVW